MSQVVKDILANETKFNEVARAAFDSVDTDKSGEVDSKELEVVMASIAKDMGCDAPTKEEVAEVLNHLDADKSGKISFNEFKVLIRTVLEAMVAWLHK